MLFKVGMATDSIALQADAWHLRTDVYTSVGVFAGLGLIAVGERIFPGTHFHWIDPVAAIGVALLILHAAWRLTQQATSGLLDTSLPPAEEATIQNLIQALIRTRTGKVCGYHQLKTRKAGPARFIEFHLFCDGRTSTEESHTLAHELSAEIGQRLPQATVTIHVEPCVGNCTERCLGGCLLSEEQRRALRTLKEKRP
jgi:cation diffusion facilitator family transporter